MQDLGTALRRDVNGALTAASAEEAAALGRLEARLAVSGSLHGLVPLRADCGKMCVCVCSLPGQIRPPSHLQPWCQPSPLLRHIDPSLPRTLAPHIHSHAALHSPPAVQSLEGAMSGLQAAQADGLRRLNTGLAAAVDDAQATLEVCRQLAWDCWDGVFRPRRTQPQTEQNALCCVATWLLTEVVHCRSRTCPGCCA